MWYEVLPAYFIITAALTVPSIFALVSNKLVLGQAFRRTALNNEEAHKYMRDARLSGKHDAYGYRGLDAIPDPK